LSDINWFRYAAPQRFYPLAGKVTPWLWAGAVLLGHIGDRYGRKRMLLLGVSTMGLASGGIALLPTFAQAGIWAPILLVVLRALQGLSVGGEYTGAMAYTAECAPLPRRGFFTSLVTVGSLVGMAAGSAVAA
jgi:MHS family proline/betaine transporter-like MFS transporter